MHIRKSSLVGRTLGRLLALQQALPRGCKCPPWTWRRAVKKRCDGHEDVQHAGVLALLGAAAKAFVQREGVLSHQLLRPLKAKQAKVCCDGWTNVWKIRQGAD